MLCLLEQFNKIACAKEKERKNISERSLFCRNKKSIKINKFHAQRKNNNFYKNVYWYLCRMLIIFYLIFLFNFYSFFLYLFHFFALRTCVLNIDICMCFPLIWLLFAVLIGIWMTMSFLRFSAVYSELLLADGGWMVTKY